MDSRISQHWLLDSLSDGVVLIDEAWRVARVNRAAEAILGVDGAALHGRPASEEALRLPAGWMAEARESMVSRVRRDLPLTRVQREQEPRYFAGEVHAAPEGGIALVVRDLTSRQLDEETLRLRDRAMAASINGVILTEYAEGSNPIIYVNPAFSRITGYSREEALGRDCRFLQGDDRDQPALAEIREAVREGKSCTVTLRNYRKDGTLFWNELSVAPVRDDRGRLTHFVGIQQDVTERKRAQDDLLERAEELKAARDELAARNAELRDATRAKDRFLATMSHEMRTPLNAILGYVELLNMGVGGDLSEGQRQHLARIGVSGRALLDLINDVLDFTRAEVGRLAVDLRPLSVYVVVEEAVELVRVQAEAKGLRLRVDRPAGDGPWIQADFRRLRQILVNLLANAVKFTPAGSITVRVDRPDDGHVAISVADSGIGIAEETVPHVFTEFYQADSDLTREYGGTGLGLAISQRLARLMGGEITAESRRGQGSTFTLLLPTTAERREAREASPDAAPGEGAAPPRKAAVPVVAFGEDEDALRGLQRQLAPHVDLIGTTVPQNVAELARRERASLIVLDVACRDGIGWEAAHEVREDPDLDDVALLLLPCFPKADVEGAARAPGAIDLGWVAVVPKPFTPDQLTRVVERAVGGPAREGAADPLDVLVVDDDADARMIATRILSAAGAVVREARDGEEGLAEMRRAMPDVAVLDLMMPVLDGFGVLAAMRADPALREIPVVVLTAKDLSPAERRFLARTAETVLHKGVHSFSDVASLVLRATAQRRAR